MRRYDHMAQTKWEEFAQKHKLVAQFVKFYAFSMLVTLFQYLVLTFLPELFFRFTDWCTIPCQLIHLSLGPVDTYVFNYPVTGDATGGMGYFAAFAITLFLAQCINETYYPITYRNNFQVTPRMVHRSILAMRFGCRTLADKSGRKKNSIEFVESLFLKNPIASTKLVTDEVSDPRRCLNLDREIWCNPWDKSLASKATFPELFHQSLSKCSLVYYLLNQCLVSKVPLDQQDFHLLLKELGNHSYHSGLDVVD